MSFCRLNCLIWFIIAFLYYHGGRVSYDLGESQGEFERIDGGKYFFAVDRAD
jgi:hypothetical protein